MDESRGRQADKMRDALLPGSSMPCHHEVCGAGERLRSLKIEWGTSQLERECRMTQLY